MVLNLALFALLVINPHATSDRLVPSVNMLIRRVLHIIFRDSSRYVGLLPLAAAPPSRLLADFGVNGLP